jgi:hypothetical protein
VLQVVARSIVRSLTEEARRVQEQYEMQQPHAEGIQVPQSSNRGLQDVLAVPLQIAREVAALEKYEAPGKVRQVR